MKIRDLFKNEWIGKATLAGLKDAMGDLEYSWGIPVNDPNMEKKLTLVKNEKDYPVKKAA